MTRPYRPSNGTEGMDFQAAFCEKCARDAAFQAWSRHQSGPQPEGCRIVAATFLYTVDDPAYPKEWVQDENGARCTAFDCTRKE